MSSLRPLATITLLAAAGVVLYMKINETEPAIPEGVGEWSIEGPSVGGPDIVGAPTLGSNPATDAPYFSASAGPATAAPPPAAGASSEAAPAWSPGPLAIEETPADADANSSPVARTAEPPAMPNIPPLPNASGSGAAATAAAASAAAAVAATTASGADEAAAYPSADPAAAPPFEAAAQSVADNDVGPTPSATDPGATPAAADAASKSTMFASARVAVQGALDRGELAQALLLLSDWYDDPSLTPAESAEVNQLLSQLAGSVIYEGPPAHRLEKPYVVQAGETLDAIAAKYSVSPQLLAKINGIDDPRALQPGQELKVVRGPFSALIDLSERKMTVMLDRRYAGRFAVEIDPQSTIEEGQWKVEQKLLTPASGGLYSGSGQAQTEDVSLLLANLANPAGQAAVLRGPGASDPVSNELRGRVIRLNAASVTDVYDILSQGSRVTIRR